MIIPKYLQRPGMTEEEKSRMIAWIETKRNKMRKAQTFESEDAATKAAAQELKDGNAMIPSVWKEPEDIGRRYAVVSMELREAAQISGYTETVDPQKIYDIANRGEDEIEEV